MAITDGLQMRIAPQSGDADIVDIVGSGVLAGTGTRALVDVGGEKAWNLTSAALTMTIPSKEMISSASGSGVTFAMRYRINSFGSTGTYNKIAGLMRTGDAKHLNFTKNIASTRTQWNTTTQTTSTELAATATILTVVFVCYTNEAGGSEERINCWRNQVSRATNDPDHVGAGKTSGTDTVIKAYIDAPDSMDYDLLDFVYWDRELTDAEAAAVADDLRTELPVGGGSDTTVNATIATISVSTYTATVVTSSSTIVNATLGTIGVSAFDATIVTESSITTEALKNNTGTVLASTSGIIASVYDLSTGALVVRKTGLTSDGSGVVTFSDVSLSNGTEYLVTITIATADGVARITAG